MIEILVGLIIIFLLMCLFWTGSYLIELDIDIGEPPKIIKIIGKIELIATAIAIILTIAYGVGNLFLN